MRHERSERVFAVSSVLSVPLRSAWILKRTSPGLWLTKEQSQLLWTAGLYWMGKNDRVRSSKSIFLRKTQGHQYRPETVRFQANDECFQTLVAFENVLAVMSGQSPLAKQK